MSVATNQSELTLARMIDEREQNTRLHESVLAAIEASDDKTPDDAQRQQLKAYRARAVELDEQITDLMDTLERNRKAEEASAAVRRAIAGRGNGIEADGDGIVYRDFLAYARDEMLARSVNSTGELAKLASQWGGDDAVREARERLQLLKRTPADTLSSNVAGLSPSQHINQIFQVIDTSRPIVASATRATLERLTLTYPFVSQKPVVAVQANEKAEGGNTGLIVTMETTTASTYLGGGDISWQAAQFTTPSALDLWFRIVTGDYALKTEQDAAQVIQHSGFTYNISTTLSALTDFNDVVTAIAAGAGDVYANSGRMADTIYMAPNAFFSLAGISGPDSANFINTGLLNLSAQGGSLAGLSVVVSRGMDTGVIVVGDSDALIVAENAGAPVELRVVEPAIGGFEVGLIGAFEAVVADPGAFAMITTAS